ncbi:transcription initiation protein [Georgenia sp. 311]|uniref:Transcription initiation protein n=1 Tax=Georgenia wutianyii TaxID=2585135 RepID=A0ABX5VT58_9MICO|nr:MULTISPECIES: YciI family protein [Georgenia]QDB80459.1 transcription initiation protein [Georgenia wutianyii]TNC18329.1 transcription initiation protein [Georgenia sp. 311]
MRYLMLICHDAEVHPGQEELAADPDHQRWLADVTGRGAFLGGDRLRPAETATSVRVRDGRTLVTDGPFAETKEFVGGYVLLECADLDEALEIAAAHPFARRGTVEVRPVWEP